MQQAELFDEEDFGATSCCAPLQLSYAQLRKPTEVEDLVSDWRTENVFWTWPFFGPLLFENRTSDARDHCANERTFLSFLRLSVYMAVVSVAIVLSFHLKSQPSKLELQMARPLGFIFWLLSLACLMVGFCNYMQTVNKYSRKVAIVQSGWRTQSVMSMIALAIVGTCIIMLVVAKLHVDVQ
ncbi:hypothetical protein BKA67DRAFT_11604 [Truncatella angustata]|uniref:DUF202 domain-containing protein n=1 Tax=Truncatella angustata TaxID=152316 RepID=A0A9P8UW91_9PEZI|nr:uncharacterized protein BKA67DRAFT_11604 [Truncatella angustata]KAH6659362.1 hypothetical protein BKA67DRAFT_11604 [Truncatella angustata]